MLQKHEGSVAPVSGSAVTGTVTDVTGKVNSDLTQFLDTSVCQKLPETVTEDEQISVILSLDTDTVLDGYNAGAEGTVADYAVSAEGKKISASIERESNALLNRLSNAGIPYQVGNRYDTLLGGVEVDIRASSFDALCKAVDGKAAVMVGEVYAECETEVVENKVNVYNTGIFDSSDSEYDGKGTVIAVLDTGLDYTHSAFAVERFNNEPETDVITMESLSEIVPKLRAKVTSPDVTAQSLYISRKVPFGYDYADQDDEVSPINSEHGTHVAGIMVGNDIEVNREGIRGVAPNAQLAVMKVFSERTSGARTSWILAALEDCVTLGVDVINMSLGTAAGFSREADNDQRSAIYDRIKEQGISLIAAASNDFNSTYGSDKNGNLPLTSNPDSATVGAPSTYDAALSVASISGVKTPYLLYNGSIVYFTESTDSAAEPKDFVDEILGSSTNSKEFEYVTVPGVGRASDYSSFPSGYLNGKIALVKRGTTNFEEKASVARSYGAAGCIVYNNVSGDIAMNVGRLGDYPVCSISKDDGEMLRAVEGGVGKITISREQEAGPFMSDFSSWGPAPDLSIKPEITAHGGDIYSSVPGGRYDRMSGTSMASPNQAGFTALVRQYVKENFTEISSDPVKVTEAVNQLMMSTADIAKNTNGLPFSVRKQGAGLANLTKSTTTPAYLQTFDRKTDKIMDKAKIELGDDPDKNGVYTLKFNIKNISSSPVTYDVSAIVMTEGVSETNTYKGDTTVTQKGYMLSPDIKLESVIDGSMGDNKVTVAAKGTATVTLSVTLSGKDREYLDTSFKNGMYVEGFVTLKGEAGEVDLNAPFLAFYGDWGAAPLFDLDYFETYKDELNENMETLDKVLPDAYATRPLGGLYDDYIVYLGAYPFQQDPASTNIVAADRERIALSNQVGSDEGGQGGVNSIYAYYLGLLRNARRLVMTVTDTVTGEVIYTYTEDNVRKSYNYGGGITPTIMRVNFNVNDFGLKNNTKYVASVKGYIDYDDETVANDVFEFPFYTDFTAPIVTGVEYTYEYDKESRKNRLFANISIFDNHYVQAMAAGYLSYNRTGEVPYTLYTFDRYLTPVSGVRNSTNIVQIELTDHLEKIKSDSYNGRSFVVQLVDCAENTSEYEFLIPDDIGTIDFGKELIEISPNEVYTLAPTVSPVENKAWIESIVYSSEDEDIARVVNGKLLGISSGTTTITARSNKNDKVFDTVTVKVLSENDPGYNGNYAQLRIEPNSFRLTGYLVNRVYYFASSDERDLGTAEAGYTVKFSSGSPSLKMFPDESITLQYDFTAYLDPSQYRVTFSSNRPNIVSVDPDTGIITALNDEEDGSPSDVERSAIITATLCMKDASGEFKSIGYSRALSITVKVPYITNGPYLMSYMGRRGDVVIPDDYGFTTIQDFAFSNYEFIPKDLAAGDVIDEEDPYGSKQWYIGDNAITSVVIPEGVESIGLYAFAGLTALRTVTLPSTLTKIQTGAFRDCTALSEIKFSGANNLQFINEDAFENCKALINFELNSVISIGNGAFRNSGLMNLSLSKETQSIGSEAFANCTKLSMVTVGASKVKIGAGAFKGCTILKSMTLNTSVLSAEVFEGCKALTTLTIGKDVEVIGQSVFKGSGVRSITVDPQNDHFIQKTAANNVSYLVEKDNQKVLVLVAPSATSFTATDIEEIATGAMSSSTQLISVNLTGVKKVGDYAFADCSALRTANLGTLESVGKYAFANTAVTTQPTLAENAVIDEYAFAKSKISSVSIPNGVTVGANAFRECASLTSAEIGDNVTLGESSFFGDYNLATVKIGNNAKIGRSAFGAVTYRDIFKSYIPTGHSYPYHSSSVSTAFDPYLSALTSLTIGDDAQIGDYAFVGAGCAEIVSGSTHYGGELKSVSLGKNAEIGDYAFYDCHELTEIDLSSARSIGDYAFAGYMDEIVIFYSSTTGEQWEEIWTYMPFAAAFESVDLSSAVSVGMGAFSMNEKLADVTLPDTMTSIAPFAFEQCVSLKEIDLTNVGTVGVAAFAASGIESVDLAERAVIGDEAFASCLSLTDADLSDVVYIGASAFTGTPLTKVDLTSAQFIGDFAFVGTSVTDVTLGNELMGLGENPFAGCDIPVFSKDGETTFDLSEAVKVIDGVLYGSCANGLVLVCYPLGKTDTSYTVQDGTVRIGAGAFLNAGLITVELARQVQAIGDRAFYGCNDLTAVVFTSINAPILEETYLEEYETETDDIGAPLYLVDAVGYYMAQLNDGSSVPYGREIVDFKMWLADPTNVLYGANFIARIGNKEGRATLAQKNLVMIRPINGTGYDNFIYNQYFKAIINGPTAITDATAQVISLIDALPSLISLTDKAQVEAVRALYNALAADQQGRVDNIQKLIDAERTIEYLEQNEQPGTNDPTPSEPTQEEEGGCGGCGSSVGTGAAIVLVLLAAVCALTLLRKKDGKRENSDHTEKK